MLKTAQNDGVLRLELPGNLFINLNLDPQISADLVVPVLLAKELTLFYFVLRLQDGCMRNFLFGFRFGLVALGVSVFPIVRLFVFG